MGMASVWGVLPTWVSERATQRATQRGDISATGSAPCLGPWGLRHQTKLLDCLNLVGWTLQTDLQDTIELSPAQVS